MKVQGDRKTLHEAAAFAHGVVPSRPGKPILQNVLLETKDNHLFIQATDLEIGISIKVEKVEVEEEGKAVVSCAKLVEVLSRVLDSRVSLCTEDQAVRILTARGNFKILGDKPEDFPSMAEHDWSESFQVDSAAVAEMIKKTRFAVAAERTRYALNGSYLLVKEGKMEIVATDGKRLAKISRPVRSSKNYDGVIIPAKCMDCVEKISLAVGESEGGIQVAITQDNIFARGGNYVLTSRLAEGHFPDYEAVIPKGTDKVLTIETKDFLQAIMEGAVLGDKDSMAVRFNFKDGKLHLSSRSPLAGEAKVELDVAYEGEDFEVAFNPDYLLEMLRVQGTGELKFKFKDGSSAAILDPGGNYIYIVMPVSIE